MARTLRRVVTHFYCIANWLVRLHRRAYLGMPLGRGLPRSRVRVFQPFFLNSAVEPGIRVVRSRKADALRKAYAKYGDKVDIVVIEDLARGDFTEALKGVSAVIHTATAVPGREELKDILEVGCPPVASPISGSHVRFPDHQGRSAQYRPPSRCRGCQSCLLRWDHCRPYRFHQPSNQGTFDRQGLERAARGCRFEYWGRDPRVHRCKDTSRTGPLETR